MPPTESLPTKSQIAKTWTLLFSSTVCVLLSASSACWAIESGDQNRRLNVLFIAVDDLRPTLRCYGDSIAVTPNIDRLANRGTLFSRAYCQQAVCSPSRLSLLTGLRPDTIRVWDLKTHFREAIPNLVTLPQHFRQSGYFTRSIGKIFHGSGPPSKDPPSWSAEPTLDYVREPELRYSSPENLKGSGLKRAASESADVPDHAYTDGLVANEAVNALELLAKRNTQADASQPFFLAVGFRKPHLPFCAPSKYWELYESSEIPPLSHPSFPTNAPEYATRSWRELEGYQDIPKDGKLTDSQIKTLRHGYYACVSYVDAQIGKVLAALESNQLHDSTAIILWSDHGFHLGEQGLWTKANNFELATRVPLIVSAPGLSQSRICDALVELVDLYPTLADVCKLPPVPGLEGTSLLPLLSNPLTPWKAAVFSQFPRDFEKHRHSGHGDVMGYAMRTERYRYVEWREWESQEPVARELYDLASAKLESENLAEDSIHNDLISSLSERLNAGWKAALPSHRN